MRHLLEQLAKQVFASKDKLTSSIQILGDVLLKSKVLLSNGTYFVPIAVEAYYWDEDDNGYYDSCMDDWRAYHANKPCYKQDKMLTLYKVDSSKTFRRFDLTLGTKGKHLSFLLKAILTSEGEIKKQTAAFDYIFENANGQYENVKIEPNNLTDIETAHSGRIGVSKSNHPESKFTSYNARYFPSCHPRKKSFYETSYSKLKSK